MPYFIDLQTKLFNSSELVFEEKEKLDKFLSILEESGVGKIIEQATKTDRSKGGRIPYNPYRLFATIVYAFSKHSGSLRKIEESIYFDLRFIYLMDNYKPSYVTISKFLNNVVVKFQKELFYLLTKTIIDKFNISIDDVFLDGTKLEANANKFKFVWKPTTHKKNLCIKIKTLLSPYFSFPESKTSFVSKEVGDYIQKLLNIISSLGLDVDNLKTGKGIRNPQVVKDYFLLNQYLLTLLRYEEQDEICGPNRNSFYKTDKDATAMCLKEDYYSGLGSNMHAGYNFQLLVSKGLILHYFVCQDRNDTSTLPSFLTSFYEIYSFFPKRLCADAGYGSLTNYLFTYNNNIESYIKPLDWSSLVSGKTVPLYYFDNDFNLICLNKKIATKINYYYGRHPHGKASFYFIGSCARCKFKPFCQRTLKKFKNERVFEADPNYFFLKQQNINNLLSPKGIEMRVNRSSQVEGAFGVIKQDMDYERVRRRGLENVSAEVMLVSLGYNVKKLFLLIGGKAKLDYWSAPINLQPEVLPQVKLDKLLNLKPNKKGKNATLRNSYKHKKGR